jgi:ATP-binding cassette subfamily F protein 3
MIDIINLSVQFTGDNLFEDVNIKINRDDKIALVGSNGKGKSTLLKIICGLELPETGKVLIQKGTRIGYLPQDLIRFKERTLLEEVKSSMPDIKQLEEKEASIISQLESADITEAEKKALIEELGEIHHLKEQNDYYSLEARAEKVLTGLGFKNTDFNRRTEEFSGGWQMRIQLAKILLGENDLILLDEPTNHLDIDTLMWLEGFLKNYRGALIIVSHDRHFINNVTNKTLEIFNRKINFFPGTYDQYLRFRKEREIQLKEAEKNLEKKIKETERFIERFRYKATKARQVQSRIKQLEKLERVELEDDEKHINFRIPEVEQSGAIPVELKKISKSYGVLKVLENIDVKIERGEKIAIVGPNGAGKTTLAKVIAKRIEPSSGEVIYGHNTIVSYYEQEVTESLNGEDDLIDSLQTVNDELTPGQLRSLLGSFLFTGDSIFKKVKVLSGGEKSRLALARLLLTKSNVIILDEPTNHLDYSSKEILQNALADFKGTLIIVSHDIDFLKPIINKVYELRDKSLRVHYGGIDYYLSRKEEERAIEESAGQNQSNKSLRKETKRKEAELRQLKYKETKELRERLYHCEERINELEQTKLELEKELADPKTFNNPEFLKEKNIAYNNIKKELELTFEEWAELSTQLESIEEKYKEQLG